MDINNIIIALLVSLYAYIISEVFYNNKGQIGLFLLLWESLQVHGYKKNHVKKKIVECSYLKDSLGDKNQAR